jgi:hypothetical protein
LEKLLLELVEAILHSCTAVRQVGGSSGSGSIRCRSVLHDLVFVTDDMARGLRNDEQRMDNEHDHLIDQEKRVEHCAESRQKWCR